MLSLTSQVRAEVEELPEVVVTAEAVTEQIEEEERTIPAAGNQTTLDSEVLAESSANFLSELLETRAGISSGSFFGNGDFATPQFRGFGEAAQLRSVVTVDGVPISRGDLAIGAWSETPLASLEEVTVLRGGRTVRHGPGAVAGVIALKTRQARDESELSLRVLSGSDATNRQQFVAASQLGGWGIRLTGEYFETDGFRDNSAQDSLSGALSVVTPEAAWGDLRLTLTANESRFEDPGALSLSNFREDSRQSFFPDQVLESENYSLGQQLALNGGEHWEVQLRSRGGYNRRDVDYQGRLSDGETIDGAGEVVFVWKKEEWQVEAGLRGDVSHLDFERSQPLGAGLDEQSADLTRSTWGGFLLARWEPTERWAFTAGASWDFYRLDGEGRSESSPDDPRRNFSNSTTDGEAAFEFGAEFQVSERIKAWARWDQSVRFPVLDEVAFFQGFDSDIPFNTGLQPELGRTVEVGLIWEEEDSWSVGITLFGQWTEDEIFFDAFANVNDNLSDTERLGLELNASWESQHWEAGLFYNATLARFRNDLDDGERVPLVPRHSVFGHLTWKPTSEIKLGLEGQYVSSQLDGNNRGEIGRLIQFRDVPSRVLWHATASWKVNEHLAFFGRVNNVLDRDFVSTQFSGGIFPGSGRQFILGGKVSY